MFNLHLHSWQENDYDNLVRLKERLPNALVLQDSNKSSGIHNLASCWIKFLLCHNPVNKNACEKCPSCTFLCNGSHPDFYFLTAYDDEKKNKIINISDIRNAINFLSTASHISKYKIILIDDFSLLNVNSSNALLKIIEEPPANALFILLGNNINQLLPTIRSRCHIFTLSQPSFDTALNYIKNSNIQNYEFWLNYYDNNPLFEIEINPVQLESLISTLVEPNCNNIFSLTKEFNGKIVSFKFFIDFMLKWLSDIACAKVAKGRGKYFIKYDNIFNPLLPRLDLERLFYLNDRVIFLCSWLKHPLNYKLQIESILLQYQQLFISR